VKARRALPRAESVVELSAARHDASAKRCIAYLFARAGMARIVMRVTSCL
jgi:hypothetical protein